MSFSRSHPFVLFIYFTSVICMDILYHSPIFLTISFLGAFLYRCIYLKSLKIIKELFLYILLVALFTIINPLFAHNGETILFFLGNNALTAEAVFSGFCTGLEAAAVICWFCIMAQLMPEEKWIYLVSGILPRFAVFLSRIMKFVPSMKRQYRSIYTSQKALYSGYRSVKKKLHIKIKSFSALVTWMIEESADSSDSMYAKGYGLSGRTTLSLYRFKKQDVIILFALSYTVSLTAAALKYGSIGYSFYPETSHPKTSVSVILIFILWTVLSIIPFLTEICEEYKWKLLRSKI